MTKKQMTIIDFIRLGLIDTLINRDNTEIVLDNMNKLKIELDKLEITMQRGTK